MTQEASGVKVKRRSRLAFWGLGLALIGAMGFILYAVPGRSVDQEVERLRQMGVPMSGSEVAALTATDHRGLEAANLYRKAVDQWTKLPRKTGTELIQLSKWMPGNDRADEDAALKAATPTFELVEEASRAPKVDFARDWSAGPAVTFAELGPMRNLATILAYRARLQAADGDFMAAIDGLATADRVRVHASSEPTLISMLVGVAADQVWSHVARDLAKLAAEDPKHLSLLLGAIENREQLTEPRRSLLTEAGMGHMAFRDPSLLGNFVDLGSSSNHLMGYAFRFGPIRRSAHVKFLRAWREAWESFPKEPNDWEGYANVLQRTEASLASDQSISGKLNQIFWPVFFGAMQSHGRALAERRLLETGVRLILHYRERGRLPDDLPQFGESSIDPFDGAPLRYIRKNDGFLLYSVGPDKSDDGGKLRDYKSSSSLYDQVWEVKLPVRRK